MYLNKEVGKAVHGLQRASSAQQAWAHSKFMTQTSLLSTHILLSLYHIIILHSERGCQDVWRNKHE